jgi:hypothetical protein
MYPSAAPLVTYSPWPAREAVVADLRRHPVPAGVPRRGVVHRHPARRGQAGPQHLPVLGDQAVEPRGQQPHHLPLRDLDADPGQQGREPLRRHLALGMRHEQEAAQPGPEAADDAGRQGRQHRLAGRCRPALPPVAHHLGREGQLAHQDVLIALEP